MNDETSKHIEAITDLAFSITSEICGNSIDCIYSKLIKANLDSRSLGFWVWDLKEKQEIYSPKFRKTLGFKDENDFPNKVECWQEWIKKEDLERALKNLKLHIKSKGEYPYKQTVTYYKKQGGTVELICYGKITKWHGNDPGIMIGVHLSKDGKLIT